ncbi:MAG: hypothetical protein AUJ52_14770 [Elusimicrobia bacterium CG1_02_63_36]|nr:MAG: hypothetical protein AUJ52_14770 [Elusimicrobia bacterium CG1_02_63_36]
MPDLIGKQKIQLAAERVGKYKAHLITLRGKLFTEFGEIEVPEKLADAIDGASALHEHLLKAGGHVVLDDASTVVYIAALRWQILQLDSQISEKRNRGASEEMVRPLADKKKELEAVLGQSAYAKYKDVTPLLEDSYLKPRPDLKAAVGVRAPESGNCFVVIASDKEEGQTVHETRYRSAIEPGIKAAGFNPIRNVDGNHPNWFMEMIHHLRTCELAVVDLTDLRPNCIWELGILNAWDVPVVLIQPKNLHLPSDIFSQRVSVFYRTQEDSELATLENILTEKIRSVMDHPERGRFLPGLARSAAASKSHPADASVLFTDFEERLLNELNATGRMRLDNANRLHTKRLIDLGLIQEVPFSSDFLGFPKEQFGVELTSRGKDLFSGRTSAGPTLSTEARELLLEAVKDKNGTIMRLGSLGGIRVITNRREFGTQGDARTEAKWISIVDELHNAGLIEDRAGKGELFFLTNAGYEVADSLSTSAATGIKR